MVNILQSVPGHLRLFGDESDLQFWTVAAHYLQTFSQERQAGVAASDGRAESSQGAPVSHLEICQDTLCESAYFQVRRRGVSGLLLRMLPSAYRSLSLPLSAKEISGVRAKA